MTNGRFFVTSRPPFAGFSLPQGFGKSLPPDLWGILATAGSQILLGYFTLWIQSIYPVWSSPFWPASGAALAAVLLGGPRMLVGVYLGLATLGFKFFWGPYPLWFALVIPCGNLAETALAYFLLRRFAPGFALGLTNIRHLAAFLVLCPWIPALTSATTNQLLLQILGTVPPDRFLSELAVYSLGNATGILLVTPLVLVWRDVRKFSWRSPSGKHLLGELGILLLALGCYHFPGLPFWGRLLAIALFPWTVWGVWLTGIRGATLVCLLVTVSYFAFDVPGARPLSTFLREKQRSSELRFVMDKQIHGEAFNAMPPHLAWDISDQVGLLLVVCITLLPLGVASDELRAKADRDRLAMAALASSFWTWTPSTGTIIEDPSISALFLPSVRLFDPGRPTGTRKVSPDHPGQPTYLSQWVVQETDSAGQALRVVGMLRNFSAEEERDAAQAELRLTDLEIKTLRSHLNPHLLFNCLTGLRGMISEDPARARDFTGSLARFLRAVVDSEKERTLPLRQEIKICEDFVRLEGMRGRPISLQVRLAPSEGAVEIPPLTLVTLVENAAKHGARQGKHPLSVEIVGTRKDPGHFWLQVRQPGHLRAVSLGSNQAGLQLIRRQLEIVYGPVTTLALAEEPPGTVVAHLVLPA